MGIAMALLPSLGLLALGGVFGKRLDQTVWRGIDTLNFQLLFPALMFSAAAARPINLDDAAIIGLGVWGILGVGLLLGWMLRPFGPDRFLDFAAGWQTAWRFNTAIGFVAINALDADSASLMAIAIGFAVPMANLMAVTALSMGKGLGLRKAVGKVALNPFFLAALGGVAVGLSGYPLPSVLSEGLNQLALAAIPLALLAIGATLDWQGLMKLDIYTGGLNSIKLLALPCIAWFVVHSFAIPKEQASVLVLFAALPTASAAHVLAAAFGADCRQPATLIAQSTLLSCISLPLWIALQTSM
ncbi:AEC family transporter [Pseudovibrio sp. JE062]|uniref:AEC family transporter n=1 Tax=Pseudovibrio sp. JE062 TaxID=439495 RepID=UPI000186BF36|nr:AEC family transporter [Pseudovibrio sp. JE062]EEA94682.1 auxin efflux carrier family protein [Pseudovibrio sp. JE062]